MNLRFVRERNRRALPFVLFAPVLPPRALPERPIFVIGCPRSGTTVVFDLLRTAPGLASIGQEGHVLWETFHHPKDHGWESSALGPDDVRWFERRYLAWTIPALAGRGRFLDKTPRNALRLPYLEAIFPDARYLFVHRDGRAVVSSLHVAWRTRSRPAYVLPVPFRIPGVRDRWWHFVLPPGWRGLDGHTLEDVCAHQYVTCQEAILEFRGRLDPGRFTDVRYEDLVSDPVTEMDRVHHAFELPVGPGEAERARRQVRRPEGPEKWRTLTGPEIERVLPRIAPVMERSGYRV